MKKLLFFVLIYCQLSIVNFSLAQWTWQNPLPQGNQLKSVYFTDANNGFAVGLAGTILRTFNAGATWTSQTSGSTKDLYSVYFTDANNGFAVGSAGTILRTLNAGATWTSQTSGTAYVLQSVYFTDANNGFAVGQSGTILKYTGGSTTQTIPVTTLNDTLYFDSSGIVMVFDTTTILPAGAYVTVTEHESAIDTTVRPDSLISDTIATIFNNFYWDIVSNIDTFETRICFKYKTTQINTPFINYLSCVFQEQAGAPWQLISSIPFVTDTNVCFLTNHWSNWAIAISKPNAKIKTDTTFNNSGTIADFITNEVSNSGMEVGIKLNPGESDNVNVYRYDINPGGDLPAGISNFTESFWEFDGDTTKNTRLGFNPSSLTEYDTLLDEGKYTILFRPDPVTDWTSLPTSRVKKGMKESYYTRPEITNNQIAGHYMLGKLDTTTLELFNAVVITNFACEGTSTQFISSVSGGVGPFIYSWYGDDGFSSNQSSPSYTFPSGAGDYNYTLEVEDANSVKISYLGSVTVEPLPDVKAGSDTLICEGNSITLTGTGALNYVWNTGDSVANINVSPVLTTSYIVTGTDVNGCSKQANITVNVNTETASYTAQDSAFTGDNIAFANTSSGGTVWSWTFGDGQTSEDQNPVHIYSSTGTYNVCLKVDSCDTYCNDITITLLTSIDRLLRNQGYAIFPNPVLQSKLNVIFQNIGKSDITITLNDLTGKIVYKDVNLSHSGRYEKQLDLSELQKGIYFIKLQSGKNVVVEKVVVQ